MEARKVVITPPSTRWGLAVEQERRNRIRISVYAYAYEMRDNSLISDSEYDVLARRINPAVTTGNHKLDLFFQKHYSPDTGMWIRSHPELDGIANIYERFYVQRTSVPQHTPAHLPRIVLPVLPQRC